MIGKWYGRHGATEFRKFLDQIEANVPKGLEVHLIWDNYATHKTPLIRNWLVTRWPVHVTPHKRILAQTARALLCPDYRAQNPPRHLP